MGKELISDHKVILIYGKKVRYKKRRDGRNGYAIQDMRQALGVNEVRVRGYAQRKGMGTEMVFTNEVTKVSTMLSTVTSDELEEIGAIIREAGRDSGDILELAEILREIDEKERNNTNN